MAHLKQKIQIQADFFCDLGIHDFFRRLFLNFSTKPYFTMLL